MRAQLSWATTLEKAESEQLTVPVILPKISGGTPVIPITYRKHIYKPTFQDKVRTLFKLNPFFYNTNYFIQMFGAGTSS